MLGNLDKHIDKLGLEIAKAVGEGLEKGAKIIAEVVADKMDELHEREKDKD